MTAITGYTFHSKFKCELADNVVDYTEKRLQAYAKTVNCKQQSSAILELISEYRNGHAAIAWSKGLPIIKKIQHKS